MRVTPASFYRNLIYLIGGFLAVYTVYSIVGYDDASTRDHSTAHRKQKHLFLTVSKDRIADRFDTLAPKRILDWTGVFGKNLDPGMMKECRGLEDRCIIVTDRSQVNRADVVFFHGANVRETDLPDPDIRNESQVYIYASMETPGNTWLNSPRFSSKMNNYFNWTQTFLLSSDSLWKYGSFWIQSKDAEARGFKIQSFHLDPSKITKIKSGVFGLISNCVSERDKFLKELGRHMNVTIGGKCASSPELKTICPKNNDCTSMYEEYPFYVAMENSICKDYVTEKYWERVPYASIPIVWSRKIMESTNPPPKSFIAVDDYMSIKEMAEDLKRIEKDPKAYAKFFNWRFNQLWTYAPWNAKGFRNGMCGLCERLWNGPHEAKSYKNINDWFETEANCDSGDFFRPYLS